MLKNCSPFKLERYFARYEFSAPYLLSPSDVESLHLDELLSLADSQSLKMWQNLSLGYTESAGLPELRAEISRTYRSILPEQTLVLAPEEGIFIAMQSLLSPGDEVVAISPAYQSLYEVARSMGCKVVPWKLQAGEGQWSLSLDALRAAITPRTRLLVINFPHNPTGFLPGRQQFFEILEIARQRELAIFSDEMYRLLEHDPAERLPAVCDVYERGVSLAGMSKTFALPGLRIGWLATQDAELMKRWMLYKDYTTICSSAPSEILALMGLRAKDELVKRSLGIIRGNLVHARQFFTQYPDLFRWYPPRAGSTAFPEYLGPGSVDEFCQKLVETSGVMLVPASTFDAPGNHFRLGLGRKNCAEALQQVSAYLANLLQ